MFSKEFGRELGRMIVADARSESNVLKRLRDAVLAYDAAIRQCANDPEKMASFCSAEGDDLDALYEAMLAAARAPTLDRAERP